MTGLQSNLLPTTLPVRAHPAKATLAGTNGLSAQAAAPNGQSVTPMLTQEIRHYILGDLPTTPMANVVCSQCYGGLDDGRKCSAMPLNSVFASIGRSYPARCVICDLKSQEPSASTKPYCRFMTENPTIFHVVDYFERKMKALGFMEVRQTLPCCLKSNKQTDLLRLEPTSWLPAMTGLAPSFPVAGIS